MSICPLVGNAIATPLHRLPPNVITDGDRNHQWMRKVLGDRLGGTGAHVLSDHFLISKGKRYLSSGKIWQVPDFSDLSSCG